MALDLKKFQVADDIKLGQLQHAKLLDDCLQLVQWAANIQDPFRDRCAAIDKEIMGDLLLDENDAKRERDNVQMHGIKPVDSKLPLTLIQLDEAVTVVANILAPASGMYNAFAKKEYQKQAKGISTLMNTHAKQFGHYRNLLRGLGNLFRYNVCGWEVDWKVEKGAKIENDQTGASQIVKEDLRAGNMIKAFSMYNTLWDPSVPIEEVGIRGQFFATIDRTTTFGLKRMAQNKEIFLEDVDDDDIPQKERIFYKKLPAIRNNFQLLGGELPDWGEIWAYETRNKIGDSELVYLTRWIDPSKFGLSKRTGLEVWRFTILNGSRIVYARHMDNAHGRLPCALTRAMDDEFDLHTKSYAEILGPLNRFSSHQFNIHQRAARRKLYGVTFYNKKLVPKLSDETVDLTSARIPVENVDDIRKAVHQVFDGPDTDNTLKDINFMTELMQKILPTDMLRQVSSLERATKYQAAATVQGTDRRNYKIARSIDETAWSTIRQLQHFNILLKQKAMDVFDETGKIIEINPSELRGAHLEFATTSGLSGMDKLILAESIKEVATLLIQNREASAEFNVAEIINYWTSLLGDTTDFSQFTYHNNWEKLTPDQKEQAYQVFQQFLRQAAASQEQGGTGQSAPQVPAVQPPAGAQ